MCPLVLVAAENFALVAHEPRSLSSLLGSPKHVKEIDGPLAVSLIGDARVPEFVAIRVGRFMRAVCS